VLILALAEVLAYSTAAWAAAAVAVFVLLLHLLIDANNPNRDLEANHRLAQARVESGDLWVPRNSNPNPAEVEALAGSGWSPAHTVAYALLGLGLLAFLFPEALRVVRGWPQNKAWFPIVAGPGDEPYTYFPDKITSVKGYWRGTPQVRVENYQELGLNSPTLRASSKSDNWSGTIRIGSKESKTGSHAPWVKVQLPAGLEGKTVRLQMDLMVTYPELQGDKQYQDVNKAFQHTASIRLGSAKAGERYRYWWWGGMITGMLLLVVSGVLVSRLSSAMRQKALPTEIFVPGQEEQAHEQGIQAPEEGVRPPEAGPAAPPPLAPGEGRPDEHVRE